MTIYCAPLSVLIATSNWLIRIKDLLIIRNSKWLVG